MSALRFAYLLCLWVLIASASVQGFASVGKARTQGLPAGTVAADRAVFAHDRVAHAWASAALGRRQYTHGHDVPPEVERDAVEAREIEAPTEEFGDEPAAPSVGSPAFQLITAFPLAGQVLRIALPDDAAQCLVSSTCPRGPPYSLTAPR